MLKKFFIGIFFMSMLIFAGIGNKVMAADVWVGTSETTNWQCYVMTETIRHVDNGYMTLVRLKMVDLDKNIHYLDYKFWKEMNRVVFSNSQGYDGIVHRTETPIEWGIWQVILSEK